MKKNNKWFAIIIWMIIVLLLSLFVYLIFSYIVPFSKSVKWIENSTNAYYQSYAWIEKSLLFVKGRSDLTSETGTLLPSLSTPVWYGYQTYSSWIHIPQPWEWNSEYDSGFNIISMTEPIQLEIWNWYYTWANNLNNLKMFFRVPNINPLFSLSLSWLISSPYTQYLSRMISASWNTLYSSWDQLNTSNCIIKSDITDIWSYWNLDNCNRIDSKNWMDIDWTERTWQDFYNSNCWVWKSCIFKISVVNPLILSNWTKIPYLEYYMNPYWKSIPDRYTKIESTGKSYMFKKDLSIKIPQQTVNSALDFTVFQ